MQRIRELIAFTILVTAFTVKGHPELGFLAKLPSDIAQSSSGWSKVSGWVTSLVGVKGLYNFETDYSSNGDINIAVSGLFFLSISIPVSNADIGNFKAALLINDITSDNEIGLQSHMENSTSGVQMLSFAGFISLRAGEKISVYVYSSTDTSWSVKSQSSISFHLFGNYGSSPGFLVTPGTTRTLNSPNNQQLTSWSKSGRAGLFQSLTGLTASSGKFTTVCSGLNILTANIIFEGGAGTYSVGTVFNGKRSILGTVKLFQRGVTTLNVYQAFFLPKGSNIYLTFTSDAGQISILSQSTWSMAYIGGTSSNIPEFASYLKNTIQQTSTSWNELTGLLRTSATQTADGSNSGQTIQPSNLVLVNEQNLVMTEQTELYYAFVQLVYSGNATNIESMIAVSADRTTSTGKEGVYGSFTKVAQETGSISLAGIFHVRNLEHLSVFIKPNAPVTIHNTSFTSMFRMRYVVSAFGARIQTKMVIQNQGWNEISGPWLTETYGKFSYGTDFNARTGRFTASQAGVYTAAANIKINNGENAEIGLLLVKNGIIDVNNGLYAVEGEPSSATTLNLFGTVSVKTGDVLSLYAYRSLSTTWEIDVQSGFSITYIGPNWAAIGFHAVLENDISAVTGQTEISGWTANSSYNSMAYSNGREGPGSVRYTSLVDGIYIVSANILVKNVSASGSSNGFQTFDLEAYVNGVQSNPLGLSDLKPGLADNTRDYYTLSFSGSVRMTQGQYISLFLLTFDTSYVISKQSGFSVVLASAYTHEHKAGLLGTKNVASYLSTSAVNTWVSVSDIETGVIPGRYKVINSGNSLLTTAQFTVAEPGLFYIFGNVRLSNAGGGTLFEAHAEIDSRRDVTYGMYAVEGSPKGNLYSLNFAGTVYLTTGQVISIKVRTAKNGYAIDKGSSFSIVKLQLDDRFPGIVVDKIETAFQSNQVLRNWEETGKPGLLTSNIGFSAPFGTYTPPVSGVYIASINNYLGSITGNSSVSLIQNDNTNVIKAYGSEGVNRTKMATSALLLSSNTTYNHLLNTSISGSFPMEAGWSMYFINPIYDITGFAGPLGSEFTIPSTNTWTIVTGWNSTGSTAGFSTVSPSNPYQYTATKAGLHFISFVPTFGQISSTYDIKVGVYINEALSLYGSIKHTIVDQQKSASISGTLKLNIGDVVSFKAYSSVGNLKLTTETTRSLIFIEGITTNTEGAAAYLPATKTVFGTKTTPYQLQDFVTTMAGSFLPQNETLDSSGQLINFHAGVFLYTVNLVVQNTEGRARKFHLRAKLENDSNIPVSLQAVETIPANSEETLSLSSSMFLPRFSRVQTFISADDDASFQVVANSTFTFVLIDDNTGPVLCEDSGLNLEALNPSSVRISTEKSVTFTCTVVGSIPATLSWYKNGVLIPGALGSIYTISNTKLNDTGNYRCQAVYRTLTATTNTATLSVYDPTPSITATSYSVSVDENLPTGLNVMPFTVSADKFAIGQKAIVSAHIISGDPNGDFIFLNASTSVVTLQTTRPLDYERTSLYQLSITVVNTEEPDARNTTITFNVTVKDANDNGPVFNPALIQQSVPEDLSVGSPVVTVVAIDQDSGAFGIVNYRIISNLSKSFFAVNSSTGVITLEKRLDRETEDRHILIVEARDSQFSSVAEIVLNVTDVNDNQPIFNPSSYALTIVENTLVGSSIIQTFASDPDLGLNSTLVYSIISGNEDGRFAINNQTGVISLIKGLDYETNTSFQLLIGLRDMGSPVQQSSNNASVTINIEDINDNFAHFEKTLYIKAIAENAAVTSSVLQVIAVDRDGTTIHSNLTFSINQTLASSKFQIDPITGIITVKGKLDYETTKEYHFSVIATDTGSVPYQRHTNVIIYITDVNDEFPYFMPTSYNVDVSEFARPGSMFLKLFGFDNDTSSLQYSITSQSPKSDFRIDLSTGTLYVQNYLDRENISSYSLVVGLRDGVNSANVSASVTVTVTDENDNKPQFTSGVYETSLSEGSSTGVSVLTVFANDSDIGSNAAITYSIFNSGLNDSSLYFTINSTTGLITLARSLDYETAKQHSFIVVATDGGRIPLRGHASVLVRVIDANDNAPYFEPSSYTATVAESVNLDRLVVIVTAKDNDTSSNQLTYQIVDGNVNNDFKLLSTAQGKLVVAKSLDYERTQRYTLIIQAYDDSHYSTNNASVFINISDINDNNPVFNKTYYSVTIPESTNTTYGFLQVAATDNDGSSQYNQITYLSLENTTDFILNPNTGFIYVNSIDFERKSQYSLVVIAVDNGSPPRMGRCLVDIAISDVNDNAPVISPTSYSVTVSEAALNGIHLTTVKATDSDTGVNGQLVFSFVGGIYGYLFTINADTGAIYLNGSLDYEGAVHNYTLTVAVADRGGLTASSNATVFIQVFDVNDNQPVFDLNEYQVTIQEDISTGTSILTVHASDRDGTSINSNMRYFIVSTTDSGNFTINSTTGQIDTSQAFDYERITKYAIEVEARDTGDSMLKGRCLVIVHITDVNDNAPMPDIPNYHVNISASMAIGAQVLTVFSTDRDSGINSHIQYAIIDGDPSGFFSINNQGVTVLAKVLDTLLVQSFNLTVMVSDRGSPSLNTNFTVSIQVSAQGVSAIAFYRIQYTFNVNENLLQAYIGAVKANDTGNITSTFIIYSVVANLNQIQGIFHLDSGSGDIYMNKTTNYELRKQYDFTVRAINNNGNVAYTHVTIFIIDVNEAPYFIHTIGGNYTFNVSEAAAPYTFIHAVYAMDNDTGANGQLVYSLVLPPSYQDMFIIDQNGRLFTKNTLDYELRKEYNFQVIVRDGGSPSLNATVYINIIVLDYNDNHPVFGLPTPENITVTENSATGTQLAIVYATDEDSGVNARIEYFVYPSGIVTVNRTTGVMKVDNQTYFDYEKVQFYDLIVVAKDMGTPHLQTSKTIRLIITNVNDNSPYFVTSYYNISVAEVVSAGTMLLPLHALDNDLGAPGMIVSYIISSGDTSKFRIDNDGKLYLISALQYSTTRSYTLVITATDGGSPNRTAEATLQVNVIHVSRQQPVFLLSTYYKTVAENMNLNQVLLQVNATSSEAHYGPFVYSIIKSNVSQYFSIDNTTGVIRNLIGFDYESVRSFAFTVQVLDANNQRTGVAHVIITVTDQNDNAPVFSNADQRLSISEATHVGALVITLSAADNDSTSNGMIQYSLVGGNGMDKFTVENDGKVYLKASIDSKVRNNYTLIIKAQDMGVPSLYSNVSLTISVLPANLTHLSQPSFNQSSYTAYVNEGVTVSSLVTVLAINKARLSTITYSLIGSPAETSPFSISLSGEISLNVALDYEVKRLYQFTCRATNSEGRTADVSVAVYVLDVNDNRPYFEPAVYAREISEYSPVGRTILYLMVKDNDTVATNGPYRYIIVEGNTNDKFNVTSDGYIRLASRIDYEAMVGSSFTLIVSIIEGDNPSISNATVTITIRNENDLRPVFGQAVYTFNVSENAAVGYSLGMLNATDADRASPSNQIVFSLETTNGDFALSSTGNLTVNRRLNYESIKSYELVAVAMDTGSPSLRSTAIIKINVIDVNEERPYFKVLSYSRNISEAFPVGSIVITVTAYDDDSGAGGIVTYSIIDATSTFTIDPASGAIFLSTALNYEMRQNYTLNVTATDGGGNIAMNSATVIIMVTDVNDNEPSFSTSYYSFKVQEDFGLYNVIGQVSATDSDLLHNTISYSIDANEDSGNFSVHNNGSITLSSALDYEAIHKYTFLVKSRDNGIPNLFGSAMVTITVLDVNDNAPAFTGFCNNTVSETSPIGMVVVICKAMDKDARDTLTYRLNSSDHFSVDNNGVITLKKNLDYQLAPVHNLMLIVSDSVHKVNITIRITVTESYLCRPAFNQSLYEKSIKEDSHITTYVLTVRASDARNRTIVYSLQSTVTDFRIDSSTGRITTARLLNYHSKNLYVFKVIATAGASAEESIVIIRIIDVNNRVPIPGQLVYSVRISEKAIIGAIVIGINATDADTNAKLTYSIKSGNILDGFRVDSSGRILVNKQLDYELVPSYRLLVGVSDGSHETNAQINIEVIDIDEPTTCGPCLACPPVSTFDFSKPAYVATVSENMTANSTILSVELNQASKNRLIVGNFSMKDATAMKYFMINRTTGRISLKSALNTATLLSLRKYTFTVYNQFQCREAAAEVIVDSQLTGCPFSFSRYHYEATLPENYPANQGFLTVVTQPPSASAMYTIVEVAARNTFQINSVTGQISLISSLNYAIVHRHQFTVKVNITNLISYVSVIVYVSDVNNNCPQLTTINGTHYQPVQPGSIVGRVIVNDADTFKNHTYAITGGDMNSNFSIDNNGVVTARTVITSSNMHIYSLQIIVSDGACSKVATMTVVIRKDTPPACPTPPSCYNYTCAPCATTQPITKCPEKFCPGCPICPTTNAPCPTTVPTTSCPVKTCPTCPVTCPATVTCPVCPTLHCPGCPAFSSYIFKKPYYTGSFYENKTTPSELLTVAINGGYSATYTIVEAQARTIFQVDAASGKISLITSFNYTLQKSHQFTVRATIGSEYSDAVVVVNVIDINNNCPVFGQNEVYSRLTTPVESGTIIAINKATDADTGPALAYSIVAGDSADEFSIDSMGIIKTKKRVVIAGSKTFNLTLSVSDSICTAYSRAIIIIHLDTLFTVTPTNCPVFCPACPICTGAPIASTSAPSTCPSTCQPCLSPSNYLFGRTYYTVKIQENTTYSSSILQVQLLIGSATANFSILEASALEYFRINRTTGEIFLVKVLDYETAKFYNFTVRTMFSGGFTSQVLVEIAVTNINDNHPYFITNAYTINVHEFTEAGTRLIQVLATDADDSSSVRMSIQNGNMNNVFSIDPATGFLSISKTLYLYAENKYILKIGLVDTGGLNATMQATVNISIIRMTSMKTGCEIFGKNSYKIPTVNESAAVGTVVADLSGTPVATGRKIIYSIANNASKEFFHINSTTGRITIKKSLDYESKTSHVIVVAATDQLTGITSQATVVVNVANVPDGSLVFNAPVAVSVSEMSSKGSIVALISAKSNDSQSVVRYHISSGNSNGLFSIDTSTGVVRLNASLNHDASSSHMLSICATDTQSGAVKCHNITVNVRNENNKQTTFGQTSYLSNTPLTSTVGASVAQISATDPDGLSNFRYTLSGAGGVANEYFRINETTGAITLNKSLSGANFSNPIVIVGCATDNGSPQTTTCVPVIINTDSTTVSLPNNHYPQFVSSQYNAVVFENATIGSTVLTISASDNDTGAAGVVYYEGLQGTGSDYFALNSDTGELTSVKAFNTSSTPKVFFLTVTVRDRGNPVKYSRSKANITIGVQSPLYSNNQITSVSSTSMSVVLTKEPFDDSNILKYEIVAQQYDESVSEIESYSAMSYVSWYFVHFKQTEYRYRRFVCGSINKTPTSRRQRRAIQETSNEIRYDAGIEQNCQLKTLESDVCNGPLLPGKSYRFQLVGYYASNNPVSGAFTAPRSTTQLSTATQTGVSNTAYIVTYWIIGLVVLSLMFFLAVLVIVVIFCYKRKYRVYDVGPKTFLNPVYREQTATSEKVFYANDTVDAFHDIGTLKHERPHSHSVAPEEFEMLEEKPMFETLTTTSTFQDYETISNKVAFEEENPEWASMDISLRVDPTGQIDPVILTKGERTSRSGSSNAGSVSSRNSKDPVLQDYPSPDYERSSALNTRDVRVSVPPGTAPSNLEGTTEL